jgi:hypothetical protein
VQDVHGFRKLRDVENAVFDCAVDPDLAYADSYISHGPPIRRRFSILHTPELVARLVSRLRGECAQFLA